jgi:hypothetical protein
MELQPVRIETVIEQAIAPACETRSYRAGATFRFVFGSALGRAGRSLVALGLRPRDRCSCIMI